MFPTVHFPHPSRADAGGRDWHPCLHCGEAVARRAHGGPAGSHRGVPLPREGGR